MVIPSSILSIQNVDFGYLTKSMKNTLLSEVHMDVKQHELIGLIGRNGSGKSTMLRTIVRLQKTLNGNVFLNGKNISNFQRFEFAKSVAFVSTEFMEPESMTIRELVSLGRFPYTNWIGNLSKEDHEIIDESLNMVGISSLANKRINEVSDGERQKAMIARTLAQSTPVIILDEPTVFLDIPAKYDLINLLRDLTDKGKVIIYSSHDLNIAMKFSDRLWIIDQTKVHDGSPEDMILNNTLAKIFESEKIFFNPENGEFELKRNSTNKVFLSGDNHLGMTWTKHALIRNGFTITDSVSNSLKVFIQKKNGKLIWILQKDKQNLLYQSIYELVNALNQPS